MKKNGCLELIKIYDYCKNQMSISKHNQPSKVDNSIWSKLQKISDTSGKTNNINRNSAVIKTENCNN
jgi:hypothetical protein